MPLIILSLRNFTNNSFKFNLKLDQDALQHWGVCVVKTPKKYGFYIISQSYLHFFLKTTQCVKKWHISFSVLKFTLKLNPSYKICDPDYIFCFVCMRSGIHAICCYAKQEAGKQANGLVTRTENKPN